MSKTSSFSVLDYRTGFCGFAVFASEKGIVHAEYSGKKGRNTGYDFSKVRKQLDEYFSGKRKQFDLPLVFEKQTFQGKVLSALLKVPYGKTISYAELARLSGHPGACRAVGNVMANNPLPLFIPCHRVIKSDGSLGNFGGGVALKKKLLILEGAYNF
jgi:methylated-DNA-[protein]-cysteine S-methyltransferase